MSEWCRIAKKQDIPVNTGVVAEAMGKKLAVFNVDGQFYVTSNVCPHRGGPLGEGELNGPVVTCPWHGWTIDVTKGCHSENPNVKIPTYAVKLEGDDILAEVN